MNIQVLHPNPAQISAERLRPMPEAADNAANAVTDAKEAPGITAAAAPSAGEDGIKADIRDQYRPEERAEGTGLYRMTKDEEGNPVLEFDAPEKAAREKEAAGQDPAAEEEKAAEEEGAAEEKAAAEEKKAKESEESKKTKTVMNTDRVDREIQQLREDVEKLERQLRSATGQDASKLEQKLILSRIELRIKDNDTYRRAHASVSLG